MNGVPGDRVPLPGPVGGCLADRLLHERGLPGQGAFPAGDQPGARVDAERRVPEAPAVRTSLVTDALAMAVTHGHVQSGAGFHSDRGAQYTSAEFARYYGWRPLSSSGWACP